MVNAGLTGSDLRKWKDLLDRYTPAVRAYDVVWARVTAVYTESEIVTSARTTNTAFAIRSPGIKDIHKVI